MVEKNTCASSTIDGNYGRKIPSIRSGVSVVYLMQNCEYVALHRGLWLAKWDRKTYIRKPSNDIDTSTN